MLDPVQVQRFVKMSSKMESQGSSCPILSLPQLAVAAVLRSLPAKDRQSLASTCRTLAAAVSAASQRTTLTVRSNTGWEGLCKMVDSCRMTCKKLWLCGSEKHSPSAKTALDVTLGGDSGVPGCVLHGTKEVFIQDIKVCPLPCLVPPNLPRILPDMEHLQISCYSSDQYAEVQPLPYCSSLRKLSYTISHRALQLPSLYHTPEDLGRQLPSISTLELNVFVNLEDQIKSSLNCAGTMLQAWGNQITELQLWMMLRKLCDSSGDAEWMPLQHCKRLQKLSWFVDCMKPSFKSLPPCLTELDLQHNVQETDLATILKLPQLRVIRFEKFNNSLQHDWSQHPCTWQQLKMEYCPFVDLSKLPLHSMKGEGRLSIKELQLPDPRLPNSLADVMHAAQHVSNAGVVVEMPRQHETGHKSDGWRCDLWVNVHADSQHDAALSELIHAASRVVKPSATYQFQVHHVSHYPQTAIALLKVLKWSSSNLHEVFFYECASMVQPWFWQAMQCCCNVSKVHAIDYTRVTIEDFAAHITDVTLQAAIHFMAVTQRPLHLQFEGSTTNKEDMPDAVTKLTTVLQQRLPATVALNTCTLEENSCSMIIALTP